MSVEQDFFAEVSSYSTDELRLIISDQAELYSSEEMRILKEELDRRESGIKEDSKDKSERYEITVQLLKYGFKCPKCDAPNYINYDVCSLCGCELDPEHLMDHGFKCPDCGRPALIEDGECEFCGYGLDKEIKNIKAYINGEDCDVDAVLELLIDAEEYTQIIDMDKLQEISGTIRFLDASEARMEQLESNIYDAADYFGAPIELSEGKIECSGDSIPCVVLSHPEYEDDFYCFCISRKEQGKTCVFQIYLMGKSKQIKRRDFCNRIRIFDGTGGEYFKLGLFRGGYFGAGLAIGGLAGGAVNGSIKAVAKGIGLLGLDKEQLAAELEWYDQIFDMLSCVFSATE